MREVVAVAAATAFYRAVATTIRVKELRGTPEKMLQQDFAN